MKNYTIVRISAAGYYQQLFRSQLQNYGLTNMQYEQVIDTLKKMGFLYPGSFAESMQSLGNRVIDIVADVETLQQLWAKEYGIVCDWTTLTARYDFLLQQLAVLQPDVVYFQSFEVLPSTWRREIKKRIPSVRIVTGFQGFPSKSYSDFSDLDMIFISYPAYQEYWERAGIPTHILYHCYDPYMSLFSTKGLHAHDFTFIGSSGYGSPYHAGRYNDLLYLLQHSSLELWGYEKNVSRMYETVLASARNLLSSMPASVLRQSIATLGHRYPRYKLLARDAIRVAKGELEAWPWYLQVDPLASMFPKRTHQGVLGKDYYKLLQQSHIVLNRHTDEPGEGGNIRTFEVTGVGACLLTDTRPNIANLFEIDKEILTYSSIDECVEKAEYLLNHEDERKKIAAAGHTRAAKDHTTMIRCMTIHEALVVK